VLQRRSLHWMLQQERCPLVPSPDGDEASTSSAETAQQRWHGSFVEVPLVDTKSGAAHTAYIDRSVDYLSTQEPPPAERPVGGCLCEEMGLGKVKRLPHCYSCSVFL
jgi:hypothetical protein